VNEPAEEIKQKQKKVLSYFSFSDPTYSKFQPKGIRKMKKSGELGIFAQMVLDFLINGKAIFNQ